MGSRRQVTRTADALIAARPASGARRPSPRWGGDGGRGRRSARMGVGKGGTGARAPTHTPASPAWAWRAPAGPPLCHHRPPLSLLPRSSTPLPAHAGTYIQYVRPSTSPTPRASVSASFPWPQRAAPPPGSPHFAVRAAIPLGRLPTDAPPPVARADAQQPTAGAVRCDRARAPWPPKHPVASTSPRANSESM